MQPTETGIGVPAISTRAPAVEGERIARRLALALLRRVCKEAGEEDLRGSAMVFSPHPDDEALGCGGVILRLKRTGARVTLVHVSDGGASTTLIPREDLTAMRRRESENAGRALGVDRIDFLDFPDSRLGDYVAAGTDRIEEILRAERPQHVFLPYRREPSRQAADHLAVTRMGMGALARVGKPAMVWEYPVWFWLHWPWVRLRQTEPPFKSRHILKNSVLEQFGARALQDLNCAVDVDAVREQKLAALAEHKSQMERLVDDPRWVTLHQISGGEMLACCCQQREYFHRYAYPGSDAATSPAI